MMIFYPGPSMVHPEVCEWVAEAQRGGYLSFNHRNEVIVELYKGIVSLLKESWGVPESYEVYFLSSATECWEVCYQSLSIEDTVHIYNGSFGEKWRKYASHHCRSNGFKFDINDCPYERYSKKVGFPVGYGSLLCLTHTETSNGTELAVSFLEHCRGRFNDAIIAIDATASMGGVSLRYELADIWFASVQKCFGLPAGMCIMIASKRAVERANLQERGVYYNSIANLSYNYQNFQPTHTPNILNMYLLYEVLKKWGCIDSCHKVTLEKQRLWEATMERLSARGFSWLVGNEQVRAKTVFAISYPSEKLEDIMSQASSKGIVLGKGYGDWVGSSFRIANFPVIPSDYYGALEVFLFEQGL